MAFVIEFDKAKSKPNWVSTAKKTISKLKQSHEWTKKALKSLPTFYTLFWNIRVYNAIFVLNLTAKRLPPWQGKLSAQKRSKGFKVVILLC